MRWLQVSGIFKGKRSLNYPSFANEIWGPFNFKINQIKTKKVLFFYTIKKKKKLNELTKFYDSRSARELGVERKVVNQHFRTI